MPDYDVALYCALLVHLELNVFIFHSPEPIKSFDPSESKIRTMIKAS